MLTRYSDTHKTYELVHVDTNKISFSRDVVVDEDAGLLLTIYLLILSLGPSSCVYWDIVFILSIIHLCVRVDRYMVVHYLVVKYIVLRMYLLIMNMINLALSIILPHFSWSHFLNIFFIMYINKLKLCVEYTFYIKKMLKCKKKQCIS